MKLVFFGDSLLKNLHKGPTLLLENMVPGLEVYNCSISGWDTEDALKRVDYISQLKPDIVVLNYGTNDAAPWKQVPLSKYLTNIRKIISRFPNSRIIYFLPPPLSRLGSDVAHDERAKNIMEYNKALKDLLDKKRISYVDSPKIFGELLKQNKDYHNADGIHFNEFGNTATVTELAKIIKATSTA